MRYAKLFCLCLALPLLSCRKEPKPLPAEVEQVTSANPASLLKGFYVLNEGNMNMNKASLDYFDYYKGTYKRNIYNEINSGNVGGLGDVGNYMAIYGSKLYLVINNSNKVEVLNAHTGQFIQKIDIRNCRYITFHEGKAYVSAYLGTIGDPNAPNGNVSEIDTVTLKITRQVEVGRQPEEMAVTGNKLYVANSGGYSAPNYENTVSVVDINDFIEIKKIPVAINLHRLKKDKYGDVYVSSRGDYLNSPSKLYAIDTQTDQVKKTFDTEVSNLWIDDDTAYIYAMEFNFNTQKSTISYKTINVKDEMLSDQPFIADGIVQNIKTPHGISVNPYTKEIYLTDAGDYLTPGTLYCFNKEGQKQWQVSTGDIPAHIALLNR